MAEVWGNLLSGPLTGPDDMPRAARTNFERLALAPLPNGRNLRDRSAPPLVTECLPPRMVTNGHPHPDPKHGYIGSLASLVNAKMLGAAAQAVAKDTAAEALREGSCRQ